MSRVVIDMPDGEMWAPSLEAAAALLRRPEGVEYPGARGVQKMDAYADLWGGCCTCGWTSDGIESLSKARKSARAHVKDKHGVPA